MGISVRLPRTGSLTRLPCLRGVRGPVQGNRAETYQLTDEGLFSRHQIIESQLDRDLFAARADVAGRKLDASGKLSLAERALGEIDAGKAKLKVEFAEKGLRSLRIAAPHDGLLVLERNSRGEATFVGDTLWPGQKIAELPDLSQLEEAEGVIAIPRGAVFEKDGKRVVYRRAGGGSLPSRS